MENYLSQIFKLRKDFSEQEKELIKKAYKFAEKSHRGQKLDGTEYPYFMHPAYAGFLLAKWKRDAEEICAGFLHDVYEDCEIHLDVLRRLFGHRVTFLVDGMSWERRWNPKEKMYLKDWEHFHKKRLDYITQDIGLLYVLFSDELSNLDDIFPDKYKKVLQINKKLLQMIHSKSHPVCLNITGSGNGLSKDDDNLSFRHLLPSSSITGTINAIRHRIENIEFQNTTELNSTIHFCRLNHNEFNYSSNPTYLSSSKIIVKGDQPFAEPVSYITTIGLYS